MKLNLGCGDKILPGYCNVDMVKRDGVEILADLREPLPLPDACAEEIYACHIIEHFTKTEWARVLPEWVRLLKPGGKLIIECPDSLEVCRRYIANSFGLRDCWWHRAVWGEEGEGMAHRQGIILLDLCRQLHDAGLRITRARHWNEVRDPDNRAFQFNLRVEGVKP